MAGSVGQALPSYASETLAASSVGVWIRDPAQGLIHCDAVMCAMFNFDEAEGAAGIPVGRLRGRIHPEDRAIFLNEVEWAKRRGGLVLFEYRVVRPPGDVRWVMVRGVYEALRPGQVLGAGRGIVIDITESKLDGHAGERVFFAGPDPAADTSDAFDRACDHAIGLRTEVELMDEVVPGLREATHLVLLALGRRLAKSVPRWTIEP